MKSENVTINGKEYYPDISSGISIELIPDEGEPILIEGGLLDLKEEARHCCGVYLSDKLEPEPQQEANDLFTTLSNAINPKR